jgi:hypothetical protein
MNSFNVYIELNGIEVEAEVIITHYRAEVSGKWGHPDNWSEDEPTELEFEVEVYGDNVTAELDDTTYGHLLEMAIAYMEEM